MQIWQADFYRRPLQNAQGEALWELVVCDPESGLQFYRFCPQSEASADWLAEQLQHVGVALPQRLQVFRPQALKQLLRQRSRAYLNMSQDSADDANNRFLHTGEATDPIRIDSPPPLPLPEHLQGEQWRFAALAAGELETVLLVRPIPVQMTPEFLYPSSLQLPPATLIPGVVIDGGRRALKLARWLQDQVAVELKFVRGEPSGLVLAAGLCERWVLLTFADLELQSAALTFEQRKQAAMGLHFLLVQPDDSGVTYSGLWLLLPAD
jgi:hypothetical protein